MAARLRQPDPARPRAVLSTAGATHFLHDGFSDLLFLLLPLWQAEFGLTLAQTGLLKSCYSGALAASQIPAGLLAERLGERAVLVGGTIVTGLGFIAMGTAGGFLALALTLLIAGGGSGTQHPLNATVVARAFPARGRRAALGVYNFTGDLGKIAVPMLAALVITALDWRAATVGYGLIGVVVALLAFLAMAALAAGDPPPDRHAEAGSRHRREGWGITDRRGFAALSAIGIIDSSGRTGFLTFLPFLLTAKGADVATLGLALGLTFTGGAAGKFLCGLLAERVGILRTVILTELATAVGILALLPLPLAGALAILPLVGLALNGTSSVLYATVAEFVAAERHARGFGLFYTLGIGSSACAPFLFGALSDLTSVPTTLTVVATLVTLAVPLTLNLRPSLAGRA